MAEKKKILYIVEAMGGGVFAYIVDLANELVNSYDMYIAYAVRKQTPENYKDCIYHFAVRLYKRTARQPGVRAEMLAGFPEEIEEYIIPPEEKCDICGGEMKVIEKRV